MMRTAAGEAMQTALAALKEIATAEPSHVDAEGIRYGIDADVRQRAAAELGRLAMQVLTKTRSGGEAAAPKTGQKDLFDKKSDMGPWKLAMVR